MQRTKNTKKAIGSADRSAKLSKASAKVVEILESRQLLSGAPTSGNIATAAAAYTTYSGAFFNYHITSSPVITAILSQPGTFTNSGSTAQTFSAWTFLVQDNSAAAEVYNVPATDFTNFTTPAVGSTLDITGAFYLANHSLPEINGTAETTTSITQIATGQPTPAIINTTLASLTSSSGYNNYSVAGQLFNVSNVAVSGASAAGVAKTSYSSTAFSATLDDSTGATIHLDYNAQFSSQFLANYNNSTTSPAAGQDMRGFVDTYNGETEFFPLSITADSANQPIETFTSSFTAGLANVSTGSTSLTVTVTRNITTDAASVGYTALSLPHYDTGVVNKDYSPASGTLTYSIGQATATYTLQLLQRTAPSGTHYFTVQYSPVPATDLGAAPNAIVSVLDTRPFSTNVAGAEALPYNTSGITISSNPVITAIVSQPGTVQGRTYTAWAFLAQDNTGSMEVYGTLPGSYTPKVGDTISVSGTIQPYHEIPEFSLVTAISKTGTATVPAPLSLNVSTVLAGAHGPADPITSEDPSLNNPPVLGYYAQITGYYNSNGGAYAAGASTFGTANSSTTPIATLTDSTGTMQFYYYPSSNSVAVSNLFGSEVPASTTLTTYDGYVSYFPGSLYPEFIPIAIIGTTSDVYTVTTSATTPSINIDADQFAQVNRGDTVTVTVTRSENVSSGSISYSLLADSAQPGVDYTAASGTLTFAPGSPLTQSFVVNTNANPGDHGDKLFTIVVNNPSDTPAASYTASVVNGVNTIQITDTTAGQTNQAVQASFSPSGGSTNANTTYENATVQPTGVYSKIATGADASTDDGLDKIQVNGTEVYNNGGGFSYQYAAYPTASYGAVTFNDGSTDTQHVYNADNLSSVDGIEFEAVADTQSYDTAGYINVYIVPNAATGALQANGSSGTTSTAMYDVNGNDPVNGGLGTEYLLGTFFYNPVIDDAAGSQYVPYNLTALNPAGVNILARAIASGSNYRIAIAPGTTLAPVTDPVTHVAETDLTVGAVDNHVAATFEGSTFEQVTINGSTFSEYVGPIVRIEYGNSSTEPAWASTEAPNGNYIVPTQTLAVNQWLAVTQPTIFSTDGSTYLNVSGGTAVIDSDPAKFSALPSVTVTSGGAVEVAPDGYGAAYGAGNPTTDIAFDGGPAVHLAGLSVTGASSVDVASVGNFRTQSNHIALVVGTGSNTPTFSVNAVDGSTLNLEDNDLIVHGGIFSTIQAEVVSGFNNGPWNGSGIDSSAAQANNLTALAVITAGTIPVTSLDGETISSNDVLVKYTWFGDADLSGKVDGSDYSRIDNGFLLKLSGWQNGDFNYDGVINGSDYTLIDNAFNRQTAAPLAEVAGKIGASSSAISGVAPTTAVFATYSSESESTSTDQKRVKAADWLKSFSQEKISL